MKNNLTVKELKLNKKLAEHLRDEQVKIVLGSGLDGVLSEISRYAPFGKIAVLYTKAEYDGGLGKTFTERLQRKGFKPISLILPKDSQDLTVLAKIFNIPEDVRAVVTFESCLFTPCSYLASVRNIPSVKCIKEPFVKGVLNKKKIIKSDKCFEFFSLEKRTSLVFDLEKLDNERGRAHLFAEVQSCLLDLEDLCVKKKLYNFSITSRSYGFIKNALNTALNFASEKKENQLLTLIECLIDIEIANCLSGGEIFDNSTYQNAKLLIKEKLCGANLLIFMNRIFGAFSNLSLQNLSLIKDVPDPNERAESLSQNLKIDDGYFLKNFISQYQAINKKPPNKFYKYIYVESQKRKKDVEKIISIYNNLSQNEDAYGNLINYAIYYSGDLFEKVNLLSVLRESGLTEVLKTI